MMAKAAKEGLQVEALQILADAGYYNSEEIKACEDDGVAAYVPLHRGNGKKHDRFTRGAFTYESATDTYQCPAGQALRPTKKLWKNTSGRVRIR